MTDIKTQSGLHWQVFLVQTSQISTSSTCGFLFTKDYWWNPCWSHLWNLYIYRCQFLNQRTIGPVSLTWVLRICWIRINLEIQEHSMLYKLPSIQKQQEQILPCHKNGKGQPRVIIWKPRGMGIQPLGTSSGSILKLLLFPSFCSSSRKILFASLFYMIFCFSSYMYIKPQGNKRHPWGQLFRYKQKGLITLITGCMFKKWLCPLIVCTFVHHFVQVHSPWAGSDNPSGPNFWCQQEGLITMVICCKVKKNLFNLWLYTHLFMIK